MIDKNIFHYTAGTYISKIVASGVINLETDGGIPFNKQRPAVWCTFSNTWEPTCNKDMIKNGRRVALDKAGTARNAGGLYRIELKKDSAPFSWDEWKQKSNVREKHANALKKIAKSKGSDINLWRVSFEPIKSNKWLNIEKWNSEQGIWVTDSFYSACIKSILKK